MIAACKMWQHNLFDVGRWPVMHQFKCKNTIVLHGIKQDSNSLVPLKTGNEVMLKQWKKLDQEKHFAAFMLILKIVSLLNQVINSSKVISLHTDWGLGP